MSRFFPFTALLAAAALFATATAAQQTQVPSFGASTRTVAVYATATNAEGRLAPGLSREDFSIDDEGKRQTLTVFSNDVQPITVVILLDRSGSMKPNYSLEEEPLGTIAPLRLISDLPENFLVMNADVLSDLDLSAFLENHISSGAIFTIAATKREQVLDYGVLGVDGSRLVSFQEKPKTSQLVSMGIYAANRHVIEYIPPSGPFGFDELMLKLIDANQRVDVVQHVGYWLDIGRPEDYEQANREFETDRSRFL